MNKKPKLFLKNNLIFPLNVTEKRILEVNKQLNSKKNNVVINGLFIMSVSYLESMVKEILLYYLKHYPEKISEKKIKININKLSEYENFDFIEKLISDHLQMMSFKDLGKIFFKVLDIEKPNKIVNKIIKIKDMRNSLVHDNLSVNFKHKRSFNNENIDENDLEFCIKTYLNFIDIVKERIEERYDKFTRLNLFKKLWYYTFTTPLCANIEDYWVLDKENDKILAYKQPKEENSLSSSEKFLLDIWRSQLTDYKVDFLNMSSLDSDSQTCLYLFLKISNDLFMY